MSRESNRKKNNGKGKAAFPAFPFFLLLTLLLTLSFPVRILTASDSRDGHHLKSWILCGRRSFTIAYTHSVELTEVREIYTVENNAIYLEETFFSSYGAGLPATTPYPFEVTDEGFRIFDIHQKMDPLVYRTGAVRANHRLLLGSREYAFLDFSLPAEGVAFEARMHPLFYYLIKEVFYD